MAKTSIANVLADKFTFHSVQVLRFEAGERARVRGFLGKLRDSLLDTMEDGGLDDLTILQRRRLQSVFTAADSAINATYTKIAKTHDGQLVKLAESESASTIAMTNRSIGVSLLNAGVPRQTLKVLIKDDLVEGAPASSWWQKQAGTLKTRFRNQMRQGVFAGETLGQLKQRVRGTRAAGFRDGIMDVTSRNADSLIRTSVNSIASAARHETLKENDDVLKGEQWLSTLDADTTEICQALSGQAWDFDGEPLAGTTQPYPGPPPAHWGCRSVIIPLVKSWGDLVRDAKGNSALADKLDRIESKLSPGTQASMDGQVSAKLNYEEWLRTKSEAFQREVLGDNKYELFAQGQISLRDMIDQTGRPLTLEEIRESIAREARISNPLKMTADDFVPIDPAGVDTLGRFTNRDGSFSAQRTALHDAIRTDIFKDASPVRQPVSVLLGGGPASGKSTVINTIKLPVNSVTIDADAIKAKLPEYLQALKTKDPNAATAVHEESSYLSKVFLRQAAQQKYNTILDGTGDGTIDGLSAKVAALRAQGQRVEAHYVTIPTDLAISRAAARGAETGRFVPESAIRQTHAAVSHVFPQAVERGLFDRFTVYDNSGKTPKLIADGSGTKLRILDKAKYDAFLAKAHS